MKIEIRHRYTNEVLFTAEAADMADAIKQAIKSGANLVRANLESANLYGANLYGANLESANLYGANLESANLESANLYGANLVRANLVRANLESANLESANLESANLYGANLVRANLVRANLESANLESANLESANLVRANLESANLYGANLESANLESANLESIRADIHAVLNTATAEVPGLLAAVRDGRIDGSAYGGVCACLVGTIAHIRGCSVDDLECDSSRPAERWFLAIRPGMLPESSPIVSLTEAWIAEWMTARGMSAHPDYRGKAIENIRKAIEVTTDGALLESLKAAESALQ